MAQIICYEVFPTEKNINKMRKVLVNNHGFKEKQNHIGSYFYLEISSMDAWMIRRLLKWRRYKFRSFDKRYERSGSYRKTFFDTHKGPHRCAYCGKHLRNDYIEVDHLVPVSKAKTSFGVRTWLHLCGITNVNDPKNLVASCMKCNRKKSDSMGMWVVKGAFGRSNLFWTIRDVMILACVVIILYVVCTNYPVGENLKNLITKIV